MTRDELISMEVRFSIVAQCWQDEETKSLEFDSRLGQAFAKRLVPFYKLFVAAKGFAERHLDELAEYDHETKKFLESVKDVEDFINESVGACK